MTLMFNANTTVHDVVPDYNYATYDGCATTLFQLTLTSHCFVSNVEHCDSMTMRITFYG
jgi:hypothetical protein